MHVAEKQESVKMQKKVAEELNKEFGNDVKKLRQAKAYYDALLTRKRELEQRLTMSSGEGPSQMKGLLHFAKSSINRMEVMDATHGRLLNSVTDHLQKASDMNKEFEKSLADIEKLLRLKRYLEWISKIEETSQCIEEAMQKNNDGQAVAQLASLISTWEKIQSSSCKHLVEFLKLTIEYWHQLLKEKIGKEFEKILQTMGWPILNTSVRTPVSYTPELLSQFENIFLNLYRIQLPEGFSATEKKGFALPILPLDLMLMPLKKRFLFHFSGNRQTNRLDKPEWYLTQTLTWINDHGQFLEKFVQTVVNKSEAKGCNARLEFMKGLVQMTTEKLKSDLPLLLNDDHLLIHAIEEVLLFDRELRNQDYPPSFPCILNVLTEEHCFSRWTALEKKYADEKRDKLMSSSSAWRPLYQSDQEIDEMKTPECAEAFMILISTMTNRYCHLENPTHRVKFLDLQQVLLEDFRISLQQILSAKMEDSHVLILEVCPLLNAAHYVANVLREWSNQPFFIQLYHIRKQKLIRESSTVLEELLSDGESIHDEPSSAENNILLNDAEPGLESSDLEESVFQDVVGLLEKLYKDTVFTITDWVLLEVRAKSRPYRKEKWFCMPLPQDKDKPGLTPAAFPMLSLLKSHLHQLQDSLAQALFEMVWQGLARGLSQFIYEEVILENIFSEGGSFQLNWDMTRNLFPLFSSYTNRPENFFKEVKESCILLTLQRPVAWILVETLKAARTTDVIKGSAALEEQGIFSLSPSQAMNVLSKRKDLANS